MTKKVLLSFAIDILKNLPKMSIETSTDSKGLDDIYSADSVKLNIEDLMSTQCQSTALSSIHILSRYMVNFQIVDQS